MRSIKTLTYLFIALIVALPNTTTNSCGYYEYGYYVYSFAQPNLIDAPSYRPFFFTFQSFFDEWQGESIAKSENLKEWKSYLKINGNDADYEKLIYKTPIKDFETIQNGNYNSLSMVSKENAVIKMMCSNPNSAFLDYMIYAKSCEPFATGRSVDWEGNLHLSDEERTQNNYLIEEGLTSFHSCDDSFLKTRYAFQIVRLARYLGQWDEAIRLYEDLMPEAGEAKSILYYWAMEHYAGALYNTGKKAAASYYFAQIFDQCPSRRMPAYKSFAIRTDDQWQTALQLCKNPREKAALYTMRGINPFSNAVEEMQNIYKFYPQSQNLELLLIREIQKFEYEVLGATYSEAHKQNKVEGYDALTGESFVKFPREESAKYLENFQTFIDNCVHENKVARPHLWHLAGGYVHFLRGNHEAALTIFKMLERQAVGDDNFKHQLKVFQAAVAVDQLEQVDANTEKLVAQLAPLLKNVMPQGWTDSGIAEHANYVLDKMAMLYQKQGEWGKAFLCQQLSFDDLLTNPDLNVINDLLALKKRENEWNDFEKMIVKPVFNYAEWTSKGQQFTKPRADIYNQLLEMKGTVLLANNQLDNAIEIFEQLPEGYKSYQANPEISWWNLQDSKERFNISDQNPFHLYTHYRGINTAMEGRRLNKLTFAKELLRLEKLANTDPDNATEYNFKLGNAHFNTSYNGKSWRAKDYYWTVGGYKETADNVYDFYDGYQSWGNRSYRFNDDALAYLDKAILRTLESDTDSPVQREWAAKACFVASACKSRTRKDVQAHYFQLLQDDFGDTEFHQQAIRECATFFMFTNR